MSEKAEIEWSSRFFIQIKSNKYKKVGEIQIRLIDDFVKLISTVLIKIAILISYLPQFYF